MIPTSTPFPEPQPSIQEIQRKLKTELSLPNRLVFLFLLLFDLAVGIVVASLWLTEPALPLRTRVAFGGIFVGTLLWAVFFSRILTQRKVLLAQHRVQAATIGVVFSSLFLLGCLVLVWKAPELKHSAVAASGMGVLLLAVAAGIHQRSRKAYRELLSRRNSLSRKMLLILWVLGSTLLGWSLPSQPLSAQDLDPLPVVVRYQSDPAVIQALGRSHLVYELHLSHLGSEPLILLELAALDGDTGLVLDVWKGEVLRRRISSSGTYQSEKDPLRLNPGLRTTVFLWIAIQPGRSLPQTLRHRLQSTGQSPQDPPKIWTQTKAVEERTPSQLQHRVPVEGGPWVAVRGPSNTSGHRRSLIALDGESRLSQRFAVDLALLGSDGRLFRGHGKRNEDWYGYRQPVMAAQCGTVVRVHAGFTDHAPGPREASNFGTRAHSAGNTVIVEEGPEQYAIYAHLRQNSIRVKEGQRISEGEIIGQIGNSGHSLAPHLHFHLASRPDSFASEGLSFSFDRFQLLGRIDSFPKAYQGAPWKPDPRRPSRWVEKEIVLENMVIRTKPHRIPEVLSLGSTH